MRLKSPPAFQFYADDFLAGTGDMTLVEVGVYIRLLCFQWTRGGLPQDVDRLLLMARANEQRNEPTANQGTNQQPTNNEAAVRYVVATKFQVGADGLLRNARLESVRSRSDAWRAKSISGGQASGAQRLGDSEWGRKTAEMRTKQLSNNEPVSEPCNEPLSEPTANSPSPSPSPSPDKDKEKTTRARATVDPSPSAGKRSGKPTAAAFAIPPSLNTSEFATAWAEWAIHRRQIRKPLTELAVTKALAKLAAIGPERAVAAINHSIERGWQAIFEAKGSDQGKVPPSPPLTEAYYPPEYLRRCIEAEERMKQPNYSPFAAAREEVASLLAAEERNREPDPECEPPTEAEA